tara:strand:- start:1235 stop:1582 length:348 start_codon:yes stop_codon:yes gene_type:complete
MGSKKSGGALIAPIKAMKFYNKLEKDEKRSKLGKKVKKIFGMKDGGKVKESRKTLSDADIDRLRRSAAARGLSYSDGKKISDKDLKHLSQNYKDGGAVCSGSGSAMQGTKFRGVR